MNGKINFQSATAAIITPDSSTSYAELGFRIAALMQYFKSQGIAENEYTGVLLGNSIDFIASVFALWNIKAIPVLLNTRLTTKEIEELLAFHRIEKIITSDKYSDKLSTGYQIINTSSPLIRRMEKDPGPILLGKIVIFTSGSSGPPRGVLHNQDSLMSSIKTGNKVLKQTEDDRWLASIPFYHIGGLMIFLRAFSFGASVIIPASLRLEGLIAAFQNLNPTLASLVPTQLQRLTERAISPNPELKNVLLGGGSIDQKLVSDALRRQWPLSAVYGSTETASFIAYIGTVELKENPGSSGQAIAPNSIEIIDSGVIEGDPSGEIIVTSPALFGGYLNDPEETSRKLVDGKYFTGDYGIFDQHEYLYVLSRRTDLIVSGGENIDPAEVEKAIMKFPGIKDVCVFGKRSDEWGEVVNAAICTEWNITGKDITDFLKETLPVIKFQRNISLFRRYPGPHWEK